MALPTSNFNPGSVTYNVNWSNGTIPFSFSVDQNGNAAVTEEVMTNIAYAIADQIHAGYPSEQVTIDRIIAGNNVSSLGYPRP